ncbi:3,4-dihydroxyphenylacetate 2,3-dioxygenase [Microcella alkalica]|uniref:Aromatic ring-opening dioxygenase catalytic subunit (LigB family) n=1 Tax=Microcella alkalica TaxID=355930 RepID=A0A839EDX0_9MICO|nr:catechol 1,2-dioxygenase [Microcella alkalica]MBA8847818.1 aromatic ring-opening dioxygenase catalytic subunit (LigB family) [Microcella alkalica]
MGRVVGAAILAHVPTIMLPQDVRYDLNGGHEISLVPGLKRLREEVMETLDYDTVVVLDSHWATTVEFVITAQAERSGLFTSEELPRGMSQIPYAFKGDPKLANLTAGYDEKNGTWITPISDPHLPIFYATVNLWHYLGRGLDKRWVSMSVCQTAETEDFLRAGRALGEAIHDSDRKVLLLASGALSHTFYKLRDLRQHEASDPSHIYSPEAREADLERIEWMKSGDHARILDTMDEFKKFKPEANFSHWLTMAGATGEGANTAKGVMYSEYENSIGTGQVHVYFPEPDGGFPQPRDLVLSRER